MNQTTEEQTTAVAEYSPTAARLAELRARLSNVAYDVSTGKGMDAAKRDRAEVRDLRVALEKKRVELKAPALERSRLIDAEAKRITLELEELEKPIDQQIKAEEQRKEAEKQARVNAEFGRVSAIHEAIGEITMVPMIVGGKPSGDIAAAIAELRALVIDPAIYQEMVPQAEAAKQSALVKLDIAHKAKLHDEAEAAKIAAERAELEQLRKAAAEQKARDDAAAAESARIERERAAAEAAQKRQAAAAEQARLDAEAAQRRAEDDRIAAEQRAAAQAAHEAKMRAEREAAAEAQRLADERATKALAKQRKAEAADKKLRDAAPLLLAVLKAQFAMLKRSALIDAFGAELVNQAQAAIAAAESV